MHLLYLALFLVPILDMKNVDGSQQDANCPTTWSTWKVRRITPLSCGQGLQEMKPDGGCEFVVGVFERNTTCQSPLRHEEIYCRQRMTSPEWICYQALKTVSMVCAYSNWDDHDIQPVAIQLKDSRVIPLPTWTGMTSKTFQFTPDVVSMDPRCFIPYTTWSWIGHNYVPILISFASFCAMLLIVTLIVLIFKSDFCLKTGPLSRCTCCRRTTPNHISTAHQLPTAFVSEKYAVLVEDT